MKKFEGSFDQFRELIGKIAGSGTWTELEQQWQYQTPDGAVVNWWSNGTVNVQGKQPSRGMMQKRLRPHLLSPRASRGPVPAALLAKRQKLAAKELKDPADVVRLLYAALKETGDLFPIPAWLDLLLDEHIGRMARRKKIHYFIDWADVIFNTKWRTHPENGQKLCSLPILYVMTRLSQELYEGADQPDLVRIIQLLMDQYPEDRRLADYDQVGKSWQVVSTERCHEAAEVRFSFRIKGEPPEEGNWINQ